jgi:acyl carrier protein
MYRKRHNNDVNMNTKASFLDLLQDYVEFPVNEIPTSQPFKAVAGIDSFTLIELISSLEDRFSLSIPDCDLVNFKTIDDIVQYIDARRE